MEGRGGEGWSPTSVRTLPMEPNAPYVFTSFSGDQLVFMTYTT
jgi:hypothetical protein